MRYPEGEVRTRQAVAALIVSAFFVLLALAGPGCERTAVVEKEAVVVKPKAAVVEPGAVDVDADVDVTAGIRNEGKVADTLDLGDKDQMTGSTKVKERGQSQQTRQSGKDNIHLNVEQGKSGTVASDGWSWSHFVLGGMTLILGIVAALAVRAHVARINDAREKAETRADHADGQREGYRDGFIHGMMHGPRKRS